MEIPSKKECIRLLELNGVPQNIIAHLNAVHDFSMKVCDAVEKRKIKVDRKVVAAASLLHDIYKAKSQHHELEGADYIESLGYKEVAQIIRRHGLINLHKEEFQPKTWEEKIVFYSDKKCKGNKIVSVDERFEGIKQTYKREIVEPELQFTKKIEKELLGDEEIK